MEGITAASGTDQIQMSGRLAVATMLDSATASIKIATTAN
jgi:hypothetical protein